MDDDLIARWNELAPSDHTRSLADGTETYTDHPCEHWYAEDLVCMFDVGNARITTLTAERDEAREVQWRIVEWLIGGEAMGMGRSEIIDAIKDRDWTK